MTPPSLKTRALGSALVVLPMAGITLWSVWQLFLNHEVWPMTALIAVLMGGVMRANEQVARYKAWKHAWDGMAPAPTSRTRRPKTGLAIALVLLVAGYLGLTFDQPGHTMALGWMAAIVILAGIVATIRAIRARPARTPIATPLVAIVIRQPLLSVPDLTAAYKALPTHCWQVLSR